MFAGGYYLMTRKKTHLSKALSWLGILLCLLSITSSSLMSSSPGRLSHAKAKISPLSTSPSSSSRNLFNTHNAHIPQANPLPPQSPHEYSSLHCARNLPRLGNCMERMELGMEFEEGLEEEEGFSAGLVI